MNDVYSPAEDTFLLADVLEREQLTGRAVLEIGCGSGYLTKIMAERKANVTAIDINPAAVEATKKLLSVEKSSVHIVQSDLFVKVRGKFDLIVFNPPYLPEGDGDKIAGSDTRYSGGRSGRKTIERFVIDCAAHMSEGGKALILISSLTGERAVCSLFEENGFAVHVIARKKVPWEELIVIEARCRL